MPANHVVPTEQEWVEWKGMRMTQAWLEMLRRQRERLKEDLAEGAVGTEQLLAVQSKCRDFRLLAEMEYAEFVSNYTGEAFQEGIKLPSPEQNE